MADAPRGVDPRRFPVEWRLPALHPAWLPRRAPLAFLVPPLVLTTGPPPPRGLRPHGVGASDEAPLLADLAKCSARASNVDEPNTPDESTLLSWRPSTRAQYGPRLHALTSYAARTNPPSVVEALVGVLTERARMGTTTSSIRSFTSAVRAVEDVQWIPPAVTALHKRIVTGAASAGRHGAGTTWVEVSVSLLAGLRHRRLGSQRRSGLPRIQGPAWLFSGNGWCAARATHPRLTGSGLPQSTGRTRRAPTCQKALHRRQPHLGAADGTKPDGEYLLGCCRVPRDQGTESRGGGGGGGWQRPDPRVDGPDRARGGATPRVLGRQLPLPPPPPLGAYGQQLVAKGVALRRPWAPKAPDDP